MLRATGVIAFARVREFARVDEIGALLPRLELNRAGELRGRQYGRSSRGLTVTRESVGMTVGALGCEMTSAFNLGGASV
jgi:hypothetical protein